MLKVDITPEMLQMAQARDKGAYNNKSFMNGRGNMAGFLGEYMFKYAVPQAVHIDSFNHDFEIGGKTVDVKTKNIKKDIQPKPHYECSVIIESMNYQHPDIYVFCRVFSDGGGYKHGYVIGYIPSSKVISEGRKSLKGEYDPSNDWSSHIDSYQIRVDQLTAINEVAKYKTPCIRCRIYLDVASNTFNGAPICHRCVDYMTRGATA